MMRTPAQHRKGIALIVGACLCWASAGVLVRNMEVHDGWKITFWRSFFMTFFHFFIQFFVNFIFLKFPKIIFK